MRRRHRDDEREAQSPPPAVASVGAPDQLIALQRTAGNQAVARMLSATRAPAASSHTPPSPLWLARSGSARRLQRLEIKVAAAGQGTSAQVTSVTYDTARTPGNIAGHQGDHTTAFISFKSMVRNSVMGLTVAQAKTALVALVDEVMRFPGAAVKVRNTEYLFAKADDLKVRIGAVADKDELAAVMRTVVELRNELALSSRLNSTSTGGHGESGNNALVEECDDRLRRGEALRYTVEQIVESMWELLDYHPKPTEHDDVIVATVAQHLYSMAASYPHVFADAGDQGLIPNLTCANRRHLFYDALIKALRKTPGLVFDNIEPNARINGLVNRVAKAIDTGAAGLTPIGASQRYRTHLGL
jgi:hypothetical protein